MTLAVSYTCSSPTKSILSCFIFFLCSCYETTKCLCVCAASNGPALIAQCCMDEYGLLVEWKFTGEPRSMRRNTFLSATLSTKNQT